MNESIHVISFDVILYSGLARTIIHESFKEMRSFSFENAKTKLEEANESILKAHSKQTELLKRFANGNELPVDIILVHAQDHLMTTMTFHEMALEVMEVYKTIEKIK